MKRLLAGLAVLALVVFVTPAADARGGFGGGGFGGGGFGGFRGGGFAGPAFGMRGGFGGPAFGMRGFGMRGFAPGFRRGNFAFRRRFFSPFAFGAFGGFGGEGVCFNRYLGWIPC